MSDHVLDRPVWNALSGPQRGLALGGTGALRFAPEYGPFGAAADASPASWAALLALNPSDGGLAIVEADMPPAPAGLAVVQEAECVQMVANAAVAAAPEGNSDVTELGDADAAEMLALATLTRPGPFSAATHRLGAFVGVREGGRLIAMAGERMKLAGFTEVSGVCTHPEWRGRGLAGRLMRVVMARIAARGEVPFLHAYAANAGAIALYEALGFRHRRMLTMRVLGPS